MPGVFHLSRKTTQQNSIFRGIVYSIFSGVSFSIVSVMVKELKNLHPGQLALYRLVGTLFIIMPEMVKTGQSILGPRKFALILGLRGIFGGLNVFLAFISFRYLELGEATVILFSTPVFVTIFARVFLKEPCNIFHSVTVVMTIVGIVFITKLPSRLTEIPVVYSAEKIIGFLAAIFSMLCLSALQLLTRTIRSVHFSILIFAYNWVAILLISTLTAIFGNFQWHQCGIQSIYILLIALFSYSGQKLVVMALQCEYVGTVTTTRAAVDIGLAFLWQIIIFHDQPDSYGIIGAILVTMSIILIGFGKWLSSIENNLFSCEKFKRSAYC